MDVNKLKKHNEEKANALHEWIDDEVPQIIDEEVDSQNP
jgi:hypothetical protein